MQARHAARELGLIVFSQCPENISKLDRENYTDILLKSVRTLANNATSELKVATSCFFEIKDFLEQYENNHEDNINRPIDSHNIEVPLPTTLDMREKLDDLINVSDKALTALEIAEMAVLEEKEDTTPTAPTEQEQPTNTDDKELDETPKTGENNITNVICLTAIVLSVAGIVIIKKYIK